jgi:hypothetical protein
LDNLTNSALTQPSREYYILLGLNFQFGYFLDRQLLVLFPTWITTLTSHQLGILYYHCRVTYSPNRLSLTPDSTLQRHPPTRHSHTPEFLHQHFISLSHSQLTFIPIWQSHIQSTNSTQSTTGNQIKLINHIHTHPIWFCHNQLGVTSQSDSHQFHSLPNLA